MKTKLNALIALCAFAFIAMACNASFTTAKIDSFNLGKDEKANPPVTTFNVGDKIYAVANVTGAMGKYKMKFKITPVSGSVTPLDKDIDFEGSRPVYLFFPAPVGGDYKIDATLVGEDGKEIDKKSATATVKGDAAPATTTKPAADDKDKDDDKDH